jgi:hypothetical protein
MTEKHQHDELTQEELEEQNGEELPDREVMSTITPPGRTGSRQSRRTSRRCRPNR